MRTQTYLYVKENRKDIPILPPDLALCLKLISSNCPCLEHILMVPKVFEPLKFYCNLKKKTILPRTDVRSILCANTWNTLYSLCKNLLAAH